MSADNYYVIHNHPSGTGYCAVMGFASVDEGPIPTMDHKQFDTVRQAFEWAQDEYSEYGVSIAKDVDW